MMSCCVSYPNNTRARLRRQAIARHRRRRAQRVVVGRLLDASSGVLPRGDGESEDEHAPAPGAPAPHGYRRTGDGTDPWDDPKHGGPFVSKPSSPKDPAARPILDRPRQERGRLTQARALGVSTTSFESSTSGSAVGSAAATGCSRRLTWRSSARNRALHPLWPCCSHRLFQNAAGMCRPGPPCLEAGCVRLSCGKLRWLSAVWRGSRRAHRRCGYPVKALSLANAAGRFDSNKGGLLSLRSSSGSKDRRANQR